MTTHLQPQCEFEGCDKPQNTLGLCRGHYTQKWLGKPLTPLRKYRKRPQPPEGLEGYVYCNDCKAWKDEDEFYQTSTGTTRAICKACVAVQIRERESA